MTSRLDRLFVLLEAGAGAATRRAAARQLGEVQKAHPEELHRLLSRLMKHLRSPAWETRIAASQAVEAILANVPEWHPSPFTGKKEEKEKTDLEESGRLRCETFDIERVLLNGAHLMGSEGHEYDMDEEAMSAADLNERILKQRQQLNARLGLDIAANLGVDLASVYSNEDLCPTRQQTIKTEIPRRPVQELVPIASSKPLSSREMNLAKRKARAAFSKQKSRDCSEEGPSAPPTPPIEPDRKKIKLEPLDEFAVENSSPVPDCTGVWGESVRWPLEWWCSALQAQLFSAAWESRHGAASALRELLRARIVASAGIQADVSKEQMDDAHQEWLEDMALRLLCVLALDRFGDFVSDQVVAPVRETCAQTLGVAFAQMRPDRVRKVAGLLTILARQSQWEARHGALLGFKYLLAARQEAGVECGAVEQLVSGLEDVAEDVSAAAASALAAQASAAAPHAPRLAARLWTLLQMQDDLAAPANAYLALLAALCSLPEAASLLHPIDLSDVLPRLWPYLDHSTSSVRKAALQTLRTLTRPLITSAPKNNGVENGGENVPNGDCNPDRFLMWTPELLQEAMRHVYQRILFEHVHEIQEIAIQVWENFLQHASLGVILVAACPVLATWLCLAMQPARLPAEPGLLLQPPSKRAPCWPRGCASPCSRRACPPSPACCCSRRLRYEGSLQHASLGVILVAACPVLATWLCLAMQPARLPAEPGLLLQPPSKRAPCWPRGCASPCSRRACPPSPACCCSRRLRYEGSLQHASLGVILVAACPVLATWLCLAMQPARLPAEPGLLLQPPSKPARLPAEPGLLLQPPSKRAPCWPRGCASPCSRRACPPSPACCCSRRLRYEGSLQHASLGVILVAACPVLATWLCLAMQPARLPAEPGLLLQPPSKERRTRTSSVSSDSSLPPELRPNQKWFVGGSESQPAAMRDRNVTRARVLAAHVLGYLSCYLVQPAPGIEYKAEDESPIDCYVKVMVVYLRSGSALQRLVAGLVVSMWARHSRARLQHQGEPSDSTNEEEKMSKLAPPLLTSTLSAALNQALYYDEVALTCNRILQEARDLHAMMKHYKLAVDGEEFNNILRLEQVVNLTQVTQPMVAAMKIKRVAQTLEERRKNLQSSVNQCCAEQNTLNVSVQAALAAACANLHSLPEKLNPVVRPLMESIKKESSEELQQNSADTLAALLGQLVAREPCPNNKVLVNLKAFLRVLLAQLVAREPCPNNKVLVNLKAFLRCDPEVTPRVSLECTEEGDSASGDSGPETVKPDATAAAAATHGPTMDKYKGILTLREQQRACEAGGPRRGRPPANHPPPAANPHHELLQHEDEARKLLRIQRRGATYALTSLTKYFNNELPQKLPKLWEFITEPLLKIMTDAELESQEVEPAEELISRLQVFEAVSAHVGVDLWPQLCPGGAQACCVLARHIHTAVRHMAARALAAMAARDPTPVMHTVINELCPGGAQASCVLARHIHTAVRHMAARALAAMAARDPTPVMHTVINELIPLLSDVRCERARCGAAEALARTVESLQLRVVPYIVLLVVPLLGRMSDHCEAVRVMSTRCFASLIQLMPLDGAVAEPPGLAPDVRARRLRDKHFLEKLFNPKSIQDYKIPVPVSAELRSYQQAGVNWLRFLYEYKLHGVLCDDMGLGKTLQSIVVVAGSHWERARAQQPSLPSLVVCPPTLTGHWVFEVNKFIPCKFLRPLQYVGPPVERERLRAHVRHYNLIVASYDIVRKDIHFFSTIKWNYCVLDEGHVIKNGKTKAFKAIKQLVANHRLILSGTPIQNNVLELWSLFDFLMPGLLGTERQFTARYSRPILAARDAKATPHQLQAGALACEALHRQVLPFLLRRVKEDVLKELPPKITQDYYCELSALQRRLYEHFSREHMPHDITSHTHVFQALHYLQNVCNHPKLVLTGDHPEAARVAQQLAAQNSSLHDIHHAAKLPALKQLLLDCGIGTSAPDDSEAVVSQHRALIFCQLKKMLDIVEQDLLKRHLPGVTYLRLDGSVPPHQRHAIVTRFNSDVSIDLLLLTTAVGGLGLNLTGADTVVFVEHDWNPMKDAQAMDRAHRIGQRKVVNVYRLITRGTLEEKIMGLQKFKLQTANTVISSENAAMETMGTDQLLDLFQLSAQGPAPAGPSAGPSLALPGPSGPRVIEALPDLWDDKQYEEEYDMSNFIKGLNKITGS
ncbi:TATA-binding protein-associated factor 172 [Ostrinia nubilalis]|uniref:TATA-binding protein-associated factor 172 n=1 Tax=Ostrinia nubilalis TaxID=29057 RepID=UPI0030825A89